MRKVLSFLLCCMLLVSATSAMAAGHDPKYTMDTAGATVLQDSADRAISYNKDDLATNPVISGESPTTGMELADGYRYMPMLVQISNDVQKVDFAGTSTRAPWGGQYADLVYEGMLTRDGHTRITFLFNDSFAEGQPTSAGPVRSCRIGQVLLREEWQGGIIYRGGPRAEENNIAAMFAELGAGTKGVALDVKEQDANLSQRLSPVLGGPNNLSVNVVNYQSTVPESTVATPHPFLFSDENVYTDGYELAYSINLDWGNKQYVCHFYYDESNNLYLRYNGTVPYQTFTSAESILSNLKDAKQNMIQMSFSNVIIQRVPYEYANENYMMPVMQSVGQGNADIYIGGRYIPGYWVRESTDSPTVFFDDQGNEIQLTRGKTYIGHLPPEAVLTYSADSMN
ncbi:MAG: DUF3048 C-terminal domain-containing protein [Eubacteriales bacterium]|nr:DUF3048 C-terminal domain-containing protein [Eubacteriales bacterium]